jgi:hypothetical protein
MGANLLLGLDWTTPQYKIVVQDINYTVMAKNGKVGDGHRNGQVKDRSQTYNPKTEKFVKRDTETGRFMDMKSDNGPFKGVRKEK